MNAWIVIISLKLRYLLKIWKKSVLAVTNVTVKTQKEFLMDLVIARGENQTVAVQAVQPVEEATVQRAAIDSTQNSSKIRLIPL